MATLTKASKRGDVRTRGVSTGRKISGAIVIAVGVVFIAVTLFNNLFEVGPAFEEMIDDFRPALADESIAQARADLDGLAAAGQEFQTAVAPGMAEALGMTPEEFGAFVQTEYPAVAQGMEALPETTATFSGLVDTLEDQQELFASADAIPTEDLPATTVPWGLTIAGVLAIVFGALMFLPGRIYPILAAGFGAVVLITALVLSLPSKASDADQLNDNLEPVYTQELVDAATASLTTVSAMAQQMQTEMLPALAQQLGMDQEQLAAFLAENYPATAAAMQTMPQALERFENTVLMFSANLDNYETVQPVTFLPIIWVLIIGGGIMILAGGFPIVARQ